MNNGIQKLISMVLALSLCISVTTETAAATASSSLHAAASDGPAEQVSCETVTDTTQITEVVQDYWDNAYFEEVVIDPEQETVTKDGTKNHFAKSLGPEPVRRGSRDGIDRCRRGVFFRLHLPF